MKTKEHKLGDAILRAIIEKKMFRVAKPDPEAEHLFVWDANAAEQLEAIVDEADEVRAEARKQFDRLEELLQALDLPPPPPPPSTKREALRLWIALASLKLVEYAEQRRREDKPEEFTHQIPEPLPLQKYIMEHTERGPCTCGRCVDAVPDAEKKQPAGHTADLIFWKMKLKGEPKRGELLALIRAYRVDSEFDPLDGAEHSFIEIGVWLGCQALALRLMGLGALLGLWDLLTPRVVLGVDIPDVLAKTMAARGLVTVRAK